MDVQYLNTEEIRKDFFFCFTSTMHSETLEKSVQLSGIRTPMQVVERKKGYQLLSGFKRFYAARKAGLRQIPVQIINESVAADTFFQTVAEQLTIRHLTLLEKARVLQILDKLKEDGDRIRPAFLSLLELSNQKAVLKRLSALPELDKKVQAYIELYNLSEKQCRTLTKLSEDEQKLLMGPAFKLQIRAVELLEMIGTLLDIAGRESHSVLKVYKTLKIDRILMRSELTRNEKIAAIHQILQQARYPRMQMWSKKLDELNKKLKVSAGITFTWDRTLEKSGLICRMQIGSVEDVLKAATGFSDEQNLRTIQKMLDIV